MSSYGLPYALRLAGNDGSSGTLACASSVPTWNGSALSTANIPSVPASVGWGTAGTTILTPITSGVAVTATQSLINFPASGVTTVTGTVIAESGIDAAGATQTLVVQPQTFVGGVYTNVGTARTYVNPFTAAWNVVPSGQLPPGFITVPFAFSFTNTATTTIALKYTWTASDIGQNVIMRDAALQVTTNAAAIANVIYI